MKTKNEIYLEACVEFSNDIIVHCRSERQARFMKAMIERRLLDCKLELHPEKTKIVYCKDDNRRGNYPNRRFGFLGYTFRQRTSKDRKNRYFVGFSPAVSDKTAKSMRRTIRGWRIHRMSDKSLEDISRIIDSTIRGCLNYYGCVYKSALYPIFDQLNRSLRKWAMRKYKKLRGHKRRPKYWLGRVSRRQPYLFDHWQFGVQPSVGR